MSVTFAPVMPESFWAERTEVIRCSRTDEVLHTFPSNWRNDPAQYNREALIALSATHCLDCLQYEPMPETLMPEGYAELNVNNYNAVRILLLTGLAEKYTENGETCVELSGTVSVEKLEQALVIARWTSTEIHRYDELSEVIAAAKRLGVTQIQYA